MAFSAHGITALILFHKSDRFKTAIIILCFRPKHSRTSYNVYAISACFSFWQIHTLSFTIMGFIIITSTTFHFPYPSFSCTTAGSLILSVQSDVFLNSAPNILMIGSHVINWHLQNENNSSSALLRYCSISSVHLSLYSAISWFFRNVLYISQIVF